MKTYKFGAKTLLFTCLALYFSIQAECIPLVSDIEKTYTADGTVFRIADKDWNPDMRGNHRAVVKVPALKDGQKFAAVRIQWRRPDLRCDSKKIVVVAADNGAEIENVCAKAVNNEFGEIVFEAKYGAGIYHIYYLPYKFRPRSTDGRYADINDYLKPDYKKFALPADSELAQAQTVAIESRNAFEYFTDMGTIATQKECTDFLKRHTVRPLIFTEDRTFPARLTSTLSTRWLRKGASESFVGFADKNEYYPWQIAVWNPDDDIKNVKLKFSDLKLKGGSFTISSQAITCFNMGGTNWDGNPIAFEINVPKGKIQTLWCGAQIPLDAKAGEYIGEITLTADNISPRKISLSITVSDKTLSDKGDAELWRHSRLRWLNSTIGIADSPTNPFENIKVNSDTIEASGKFVSLGENGLPTSIRVNGKEILASRMEFAIETDEGTVKFDRGDFKFTKISAGSAEWISKFSSNRIDIECIGKMEFDGFVDYKVSFSSKERINVKDVKFISRYTPYASKYFMGANYDGGVRPQEHKWNFTGRWDSCWIGNALAGLHIEFRGTSYNGPLLRDYNPLPPKAWHNDGKGALTLCSDKNSAAVIEASCGERVIEQTPLTYEFAVLPTPLKKLDTAKHFSERYAHCPPQSFRKCATEGANVNNLHHANEMNPYINYPFIVRDDLIDYIKEQHKISCKVKLYYTVRELTNHTVEIYALRTLGHEIFSAGNGYDMPWQCEHLIDDYCGAWYTRVTNKVGPYEADSAIQLSGFSRWINYYLEGLNWMLKNYDIDGIYMDDVSFDRTVVKRIRRVLDAHKQGELIDLHSNTAYSNGPAVQYTDFFPYMDRLWFGESFKYDKMTPDQWFVRFSGIPFGVMSEMLQDGGNKFLGMVYGTTGRHAYCDSPVPVWNVWKDFGITESQMRGYWDENPPIKTDDENVKATAFIKKNKVLISLGNFGDKTSNVKLSIDFKQLDLDKSKCLLHAPEVKRFQQKNVYKIDAPLEIAPKKGLLLILSEK